MARCSPRSRRSTSWAALWRGLRRREQRSRYGEARNRRRRRHIPSGRPCPRLGADRRRGGRAEDCRLRRLQAVADPTCLPFVRCPATSSSPRQPSPCRYSATPTPTARSASFSPRSPSSRARPSRRRLFARQGAARDPLSATPATTDRSICTARWSALSPYYESGRSLGELRAVAARAGRSLPAPWRLSAFGPERYAGRGAFPTRLPLRVRMDARPPAGASRACIAAGPLRPRGLGRAHPDDQRPGRAKSGSPTAGRTRWCAGATCGIRRGRSTWSAMARRRKPSFQGRPKAGAREISNH